MKTERAIKAIVKAGFAVSVALVVFPIAFVANHVYYGHKNWKAKQDAKKEKSAPKKEFLKD